MDKKYITFYKKFILQTKTLSHRRINHDGNKLDSSRLDYRHDS